VRITFLMPADDLSGGNRVVATYAQRLQERGHQVLVVSNAADRPGWRERWRTLRRAGLGAALHREPARPGHVALSGVPHRVLSRPRPITAADLPDADVVVATWWETARWMHALPPAKGRPVHLVQGYETWLGADTVAQVHATLRLPNRKIAISHALRREIEAELGDIGLQVVPNAVDLEHFQAPPRPRGSPPTVGFIYSTAAIKGADVCLQAIAIARQRCPELRVACFGTEPPHPDLPLPAGASHVLRPAQSALPGLYAACDVWLFGSRRDSFGLPVLEAMACRTPVVAVPIGAAPELLADGGGELLTSADPAAMAEALLRLCAGAAEAWQAASDAAWRRARAYSWDDATERLLAALVPG
jgi:glycosyltransferase involved in cell wall biosynthesis